MRILFCVILLRFKEQTVKASNSWIQEKTLLIQTLDKIIIEQLVRILLLPLIDKDYRLAMFGVVGGGVRTGGWLRPGIVQVASFFFFPPSKHQRVTTCLNRFFNKFLSPTWS